MEDGLSKDIPRNGGSPQKQGEAARIERLGPSLLERVAEALIFASDDPITSAQIGRIYSDVTGEEVPRRQDIEDAIVSVNASYELSERSFRINAWAGGYRMATVPDVSPYVQVLHSGARQRKLTRSLMETVAILAYRQPVTKPEVDFVRGVDCDYAIRKLLEYGIIDVVGRSESVGKPLLYGTTDRFLELFGLNSVSDLPTLRELEAILDDPAFQKEKIKLLMTSGLQMTMSEDEIEVNSIESNEPKSDGERKQEI